MASQVMRRIAAHPGPVAGPSPAPLSHDTAGPPQASAAGHALHGVRGQAGAQTFRPPTDPPSDDPGRLKVARWFDQREADGRRRIHPDELLQLKQRSREIHDHKWRALPDPAASVRYARLGEDFLEAAGVGKAEQARAMRYAAASGLWYALAQIPVFPSRLIPGLTPALEGAALHAAMVGRTGYHIGVSGLVAPLFSTLADLTKQGQPVPGAWWNTGTRHDVVKQLKETQKLAQATLEACSEARCPVPEGVAEMLEAARRVYRYCNGRDLTLAAAGFASGAFEFIKTSADIVATALTAGVAKPLARPALNALTSLVYVASGPAEEAALMRTMCTQNAKYADILDAHGEVDEAKVKALWMTRTQVEASYVEKAVRRHLVDHLHEIQDARDKLGLLKQLGQSPSSQCDRVLSDLARTRAEIQWVKDRIEILKPTVGKRDRWDAEYIRSLQEAGAPEPLLRSLQASFADALERDAQRRAGAAPADDVTAMDAFAGFMRRACDGRRLVKGLQTRLASLQHQEQALQVQAEVAQAAPGTAGASARQRAARLAGQVAEQTRRLDEHGTALERLANDLLAFKAGRADQLAPDGLVFRMLSSKATLYKEAIAAKYSEPGVLQAALTERLPVAADVALWLNLAVGGQLNWHDAVHVLPGDPGQRDVAGNLVMTGTLDAAIHQTVNNTSQRGGIAGKVAMPPPFPADLPRALVEVAGWPPEKAAALAGVDLGDFVQKYGMAPRRPQAGEGGVHRWLGNLEQMGRRAVRVVKEDLRLPVDLVKGMVANRQVKGVVHRIDEYNATLAREQALRRHEDVGEPGTFSIRL